MPVALSRSCLRLVTAMLMAALVGACGGGASSSGGSGSAPSVPATPAGFSASAVEATAVTLTWNGVSGATSYAINRNGTALGSTGATSYTDSTVSAAATYTYTVSAINSAGASAATAPLSVTTPVALPAAPTGLATTSNTATAVTLTWTAVTGATGYTVLRNGETVGTSATPSYTDSTVAAATSYGYSVTASNAAGSSAASSVLPVTTPAPSVNAPAAPTGLAAPSVSFQAVTLTWAAVTTATGYTVLRDGTVLGSPTAATFTDSTVRGATSYSYTVTAHNAAGSSGAGGPLGVTTPAAPPPATPAGLVAMALSNSAVQLSWSMVADTQSGAASYRLYRDGALPGILAGSGTQYTDTGLAQASTHSYTVQAFDPSGASSAQSTAFSVTTKGPGTPQLLQPTVIGATVPLQWTAASDTQTGLGYRVQRRTTGGGAFTTVATTTSTSYTDSPFAAGGSFDYQIVAFDSAGYTASSGTVSVTGTPSAPLVVSPTHAELTTGQSVSFTVTSGGNPPGPTPTYAVDGVNGGNATVGTVSASGAYTAGTAPGAHTVTATAGTQTVSATATVTDLAAVATYHVDAARTGQNLKEYALTAATVGGGTFGKLAACAVDGDVYAQPLYVAQVPVIVNNVSQGTHNLVIVATMHNSVYAFDADSTNCQTLWRAPYLGGTVTAVTPADVSASCTDIQTEYGITGTPVIDTASGRLYFVTKTKEQGLPVQRLHAVSIATGQDVVAAPLIAATANGLAFNALMNNQRPGLALANGTVVVSWASHCDVHPYNGWVMAFDATTLAMTHSLLTTPGGGSDGAGGIWMAGGAPAIDSDGNVYVTTGNGTFDYSSQVFPPLAPPADYGESYLKLNAQLAVTDFYTPSANTSWTKADLDLSSSGVTVLPDGAGPSLAHPNLVAGSDKQAHLWLLDRSAAASGSTSMGALQANDGGAYKYLNLPLPSYSGCYDQQAFGTPTYFAATGDLFIAVASTGIMRLPLATLVATPNQATVTPAASTSDIYTFPSPTTVLSAAGASTSGIVWALDTSAYVSPANACHPSGGPAILRAYDATTLARLYSSDGKGSTDAAAGNAIKFQVPVVANGHVYVASGRDGGGASYLTIYGLR